MQLKNIIFFIFIALIADSFAWQAKKFTVMINPAGDAQNAGRIIENNFERGLTLQCAQWIKQEIESKHSSVRVILTRIPGETVENLQNASFSNRLKTDLYISLHFYERKKNKRDLALYYFCQDPITDGWHKKDSSYSFIPYSKAHLDTFAFTKMMIKDTFSYLQNDHKNSCSVSGPYGIPFYPLIGIQAPSFGIEVGLMKKNEWQLIAHTLVDTIMHAIEYTKDKA